MRISKKTQEQLDNILACQIDFLMIPSGKIIKKVSAELIDRYARQCEYVGMHKDTLEGLVSWYAVNRKGWVRIMSERDFIRGVEGWML